MKTLFVGNLPLSCTSEQLRLLFSQYGTVDRSHIVIDRETGLSRGFGFVELLASIAERALLDNLYYQDRKLIVNEAKPNPLRGYHVVTS